jgi:hypothetical protein
VEAEKRVYGSRNDIAVPAAYELRARDVTTHQSYITYFTRQSTYILHTYTYNTTMLMIADDWKYLTEGGKHALFEYLGKEINYQGYLLRVKKEDLALSLSIGWTSKTATDVHKVHKNSSSPFTVKSESIRYIKDVVAPQLMPYIDVPKLLSLTWGFLKQLGKRTLAQDVIPISRRSSWSIVPQQEGRTICMKAKVDDHALGVLVPNYRKPVSPAAVVSHNPQSHSSTSSVISIEIKPKAGYKAFSPLVDPARRCKYKQSRFVLLQKLHAANKLKKEWTEQKASFSSYDPLDLFSGKHEQMKTAIRALLDCPQNNLKVWVDDSLAIGNSVPTPQWSVIGEALGLPETAIDAVRSPFVAAICEVLYQEELLEKLLRLQLLDATDADGALLLYARLVYLCSGSNEAAERLLDNEAYVRLLDSPAIASSKEDCDLLPGSPFHVPSDASQIQALCCIIDTNRHLLSKTTADSFIAVEMDEVRAKALELVENLDASDCVFLLTNWLLSLAICDVSVFIILQKERRETLGMPDCVLEKKDDDGSPFQVCLRSKQSIVEPGSIVWRSDKVEVALSYQLRVIDCDQKPALKLRTRAAKEQMFESM